MPFRFTFLAVLIFFLSGCSNATGQTDLPNQVPIKAMAADKTSYLKGWSRGDESSPSVKKMWIPDNKAFEGAALWYGGLNIQDHKKAALSAVRKQGLKNAKVISVHEANTEFLREIDTHPEARVHIMIVDGRLAGKPARANVYTWFGTALDSSGKITTTHVFMAPKPVYEALGGIAVNSVYQLDATVAEDTNMLGIGRLSPDESTAKMAELFNGWAVSYVQGNIAIMQMMGQTMTMNQQVYDSIHSYNNALLQCAGWECSVTQGADGIWTATPDP